jgi:hypothetical protein
MQTALPEIADKPSCNMLTTTAHPVAAIETHSRIASSLRAARMMVVRLPDHAGARGQYDGKAAGLTPPPFPRKLTPLVSRQG